MNPIEHFLIILEAAETVAPVESAVWFAAALDNYLIKGIDLDKSFSLKPKDGHCSWRTVYRNVQRNEHLREAFKHCIGKSVNPRVKELKKQILRFEPVVWPRLHSSEEPPEQFSNLWKALFYAYKTGATIPTSISQLTKIVDGYYPA